MPEENALVKLQHLKSIFVLFTGTIFWHEKISEFTGFGTKKRKGLFLQLKLICTFIPKLKFKFLESRITFSLKRPYANIHIFLPTNAPFYFAESILCTEIQILPL